MPPARGGAGSRGLWGCGERPGKPRRCGSKGRRPFAFAVLSVRGSEAGVSAGGRGQGWGSARCEMRGSEVRKKSLKGPPDVAERLQ